MENRGEIRAYDVVIIGAGPGGTSCALALKDSGLKVAIIDKSDFPRDKVCGELMHKKTVETFNSIIPGFKEEFTKFPKTLVLKHTKMHYKGKVVTYNWEGESYTCPRIHFDNYLLNKVKEAGNIDVFTNTTPDKFITDEQGITITIKGLDHSFRTKILIGADGVNSTVAKQLAHKVINKEHYLGAVRTYFSGITDLKSNTSEIYFNSKYHLNCMWVFPVEGGRANVGFGLLSSDISKKKINLKESFYQYFKIDKDLGEKFQNAKQEGPLEGFGVAIGSVMGTVSGDRFLLIGDAASLTNPISGTGMGNAVVSGKLAADQVKECFKQQNFSATFMQSYNALLDKQIYKDLVASYKATRFLAGVPFILDILFWLAQYEWIKKKIQSLV